MSETAGFLVLDKPSGVTSFAIVSLVRRLTGVRRVGHAGTLDPLASGVLPVAVGQATRLIEYLDDAPKLYRATVRFGTATSTYDAEGDVTATGDASLVTRDALEGALARFIGEIEQAPPLYSAIKVAGKPLYRYAREGADVAPAVRRVRIDRIELRSYSSPDAEIDVTCGKGTYIRSLAHDLGAAVGCPAHLAALRRLSSGGFGIDDAHDPDALAGAAADGMLDAFLLPPDRAVERRTAAILDDAKVAAIVQGRDVSFEAREGADLCRVYSFGGRFVGMLSRRGAAVWHPEKVLSTG